MKARVVIVAENNKSIPEGYSREEAEKLLKLAWEFFAETISRGDDYCYIESAELIGE